MATNQSSLYMVRDLLWGPVVQQEGLAVYAVIDCARDSSLFTTLAGAQQDAACLFRGKISHELLSRAPHLVRLRKGSAFVEWLIEAGWGKSWMTFIASGKELDELRGHLRRFLVVKVRGGTRLFFRYYDPRVLRAYLPTCNSEELDSFFGGCVSAFFSESYRGESLLRFEYHDGELLTFESRVEP